MLLVTSGIEVLFRIQEDDDSRRPLSFLRSYICVHYNRKSAPMDAYLYAIRRGKERGIFSIPPILCIYLK